MADIHHMLTINKTPDIVYRALTEQKGLAGWWTTEVITQPEIGSIAEFIFGTHYHDKMRIQNLQKDKRVEWECFQGDKEWVGTKIVFELERSENKTILRFSHSNWRETTDFFASCNYIWGTYMTSLKKYCESGKGTPFQSKR